MSLVAESITNVENRCVNTQRIGEIAQHPKNFSLGGW